MLNIRIQAPEVQKLSPKITVVGVGGAGGNAVNNMISSGLEGCEFLVCNTDAQALEGSLCENRIQLGSHVTGGLGAGAKPEVGEKAAHESLEEVMEFLEGSNMAFITAGMGGGTGTGGAPVIAKACRDAGILTVGVVTKPFHFEGAHRMKQAEAGIKEMQDYVDTLIVIPNQNLFRVANEKTTFAEAFKMADSVLQSGVRGVTDLIVMPGMINLDFADIRSAMLEMGKCMMGTGEAEGDRRAVEAAEAAINNPLLDDVSMKGARGVIINITGGSDVTLFEVDEVCNRIRDEVDSNANIIFGTSLDEKLNGVMRVSVVATGIDMADAMKSGGTTTTAAGLRVTSVAPSKEVSKSTSRYVPQTEVTRAATLNARKDAPLVKKPEPQWSDSAQAAKISINTFSEDAANADMFEQQEFQTVTVVPTAALQTVDAYAMRGQIYQGSFIPPSPVIPEPQDEVRYAQPVQFTQGYANISPSMLSQQPQPQPDMQYPMETQQYQPSTSSGLVLRPPIPGRGVQANERRKSPSLLERITGAYSSTYGKGEPLLATAPEQEMPKGGFHSGLRAEKSIDMPSQGQLNIDAPAAPRKASEDDLDIPAFLRRQAN